MKDKIYQKPITLLREDFIVALLELCNDSKLPYFVIESILKEVIQEVHSASVRQLESDKTKYDQFLRSQSVQKGGE